MGRVKWYFDTSVLVAAAVAQHPHHALAAAILEDLLQLKHRGFTSAHSLAEFYSVMTRTPFKPPLYPAEAWMIIEKMVIPHLELVTLTAREHREVVQHCSRSGWAGGRVYDAIHVRCAQKAACERIYTFNVKDFRALATEEFAMRVASP